MRGIRVCWDKRGRTGNQDVMPGLGAGWYVGTPMASFRVSSQKMAQLGHFNIYLDTDHYYPYYCLIIYLFLPRYFGRTSKSRSSHR